MGWLGKSVRICLTTRWRQPSSVFARVLILCCLVEGGSQAWAQAVSDAYLIGPGDGLEIIVRGEPELSTVLPVRPDGRISAPLVEDLLVSGRTVEDVTKAIQSRLKTYLRDPRVTVIVREPVGTYGQQIRVVGEVVEPQAVFYRSGITLMDVLREVGGLSPFADGNDAVVVRQRDGVTDRIPVRLADLARHGDISANVPMAPGDVLIIPEGFFSGAVEFTPSVGIQEEYSDNVDLSPDGEEDSSFITRVNPAIRLRADMSRAQAALDARLNFFHQTSGLDEGNNLNGELVGAGTAELYREHLFVDAEAAITQEVLNNQEAAAESNEETVQRFSVSPYLRNRFGGFASSELRFNVQAGSSGGAQFADTTGYGATYVMNSGRNFQRTPWTLQALAAEEDEDNVSRAGAELFVGYRVNRLFAIGGALGYEDFDSDTLSFNGPTWGLGLRWVPSRRTEMLVGYGRKDDNDSPLFNFRQDIGPRTRFTASYVETLETGLDRLTGNLGFVGVDHTTGALVDERTALPFRARTSPFSITNNTTRTKQFLTTLAAVRGLNTVNLAVGVSQQTDENTGDEQDNVSASADWTRQLNPRLTFNLSGGYQYTDFKDLDRQDDDYRAFGVLDYRILNDLNGTLSYRYRRRDSDVDTAEYTENRVAVGIRASF